MDIIKLKSLYSLKTYLIKYSATEIVLIKSIKIIYRIFIRRLTTTIIVYTNLMVQVSRIQGHEIHVVSYARLDGGDYLLY